MSSERLVFNRRLLVFSHTVLAFFSALAYLNRLDFSDYPYWRSRSGLGVIVIAAPPLIPYVLSAVHSWQIVSQRRIGVFLFLAVLVGGTVFGGLLMAGAFELPIDGPMIFWAILIQSVAYLGAGQFLLRTEWL